VIDGCTVRVIMGAAYGLDSPVLTYSPTLYLEAALPAGATLSVLDEANERAVYVVSGTIRIGTNEYAEGTLAVLKPGSDVPMTASSTARVLVIGGTALGQRHIWWNFVSSSEERIERAKRDWAAQKMGKVPGDDEFIPLPER
jgi:redox-sensitive bicupin YhaK (pirin superfamily)